MPHKVKSYYCEVCDRQSRFSKSTFKSEASVVGVAKLAGNALKKYRCDSCGSPRGTKRAALAEHS